MFLDTSFIVDLMRESNTGSAGPASTKLKSIGSTKLRLPLFVLCELQAGIENSRNPAVELGKLLELTEFMQVVYPAPGFAITYGEIEMTLRQTGNPMPLMDLLIAVLVKNEGSPIITRDVEHFSRVPGIVVETY